jgi:hypothetical protein
MFFLMDKRWIYAVNKNFTVFFWEDDICVFYSFWLNGEELSVWVGFAGVI